MKNGKKGASMKSYKKPATLSHEALEKVTGGKVPAQIPPPTPVTD